MNNSNEHRQLSQTEISIVGNYEIYLGREN